MGYEEPVPQGNFERMTIPLKRVQNLLLIEVRVDTLVGNFILDTGAPNLVLNKTYFSKWTASDGGTSYGITGSGTRVYSKNIDSLIIQDLYYTSLHADLVNLGHIEDARGVKILGLLGANLFFDLQMEVDVQNNLLHLVKLNSAGEPLYQTDTLLPDLNIPIEIENDILFLNGIAGTKKLRFCLDTGAEVNVLSNMVSNKVLEHFSLTRRTTLSGSGQGRTDVLNGIIDVVVIGEHDFEQMPFVLTNLSNLQTVYNTTIHGILGYDFLAYGRVIINFKKQRLSMYFYREEEE